MTRAQWRSIIYIDSDQRGEIETSLSIDNRAQWHVVSSIGELRRKFEKQPPHLLLLAGSYSLEALTDLKKNNLWHPSIVTHVFQDSPSLEVSQTEGVFRIWPQKQSFRLVLNDLICDVEIMQSCLQKADLISRQLTHDEQKLAIICASTGGPRLILEIVEKIHLNESALVVLQHMPGHFVKDFARRLSEITIYPVKIVDEDMMVQPNTIYLPNSDQHLIFYRRGAQLYTRSIYASLNESYTPSINLALSSAAAHLHHHLRALILSGMGEDGALGSNIIGARGGKIFCQNPSEATVPSMPLASLQSGYATEISESHLLAQKFMEVSDVEKKSKKA